MRSYPMRTALPAKVVAIVTLFSLLLLFQCVTAQISDRSRRSYKDGSKTRLTQVTRNGLYGFIDETGRVIIPITYADAGDPSEGLIRVKNGDKWGFLNYRGQVVVPFKYDCADDFSEGLARVVAGKKYGYINKAGMLAIPAKFAVPGNNEDWAMVRRFSEGVAPVLIAHKYGYIDKTGAVVISPRYESAEPFSEGLALISQGRSDKARFGFIDRSGRTVIASKFVAASSFSGGLAAAARNIDKAWKYGYINKAGRFVIHPQFVDALPFSEGWGAVSYSQEAILKEKRSGQEYACSCRNQQEAPQDRPPTFEVQSHPNAIIKFIDSRGRPMKGPQTRDIGQFAEGLAPVGEGGEWGYVNRSGQVVIEPRFRDAECFRNGLAKVTLDGGTTAFINHKGEVVWADE